MLFVPRLARTAALLAGIHGTVRSTRDGGPAVGVHVEVDGVDCAFTDTTGGYAVRGLAIGTHRLRFVSPEYQARQLTVFLVDSSDLELDVDLPPIPVVFRPINVVARIPPALPVRPSIAGDGLELDHYRYPVGWQAHEPAGGVDVYRAVARLPGIATRGDNATALSVHGGRGSENVTLLDGIPVFGAVHFAGASSGINPDAIATIDVHAGVSSARFGDALSGVVELETADASNGNGFVGAISSTDVRSTVRTPVGESGKLLVSARTSFRDLYTDRTGLGADNGYHDFLATAQVGVGPGSLRLLAFESGNRMRWESAAGTGGASPPPAADPEASRASSASPDAAGWQSATVGATWTKALPGSQWRTSGWWTGSSATIAIALPGAERVMSGVSEFGLSTSWSRAYHGGTLLLGSELTRPATSYVTRSATPFVDGASGNSVPAAPIRAALYAEADWHPVSRADVRGGLRAAKDFNRAPTFDPRVVMNLRIGAGLRIETGFGQTHQAIQSMLNEENLMSAIVGPSLLVNTVRPASAQQWVLSAQQRISSGVAIAAHAYARNWHDVLVPATTSAGFFATTAPALGDGTARGIDASLSLSRHDLSVDLTAGLDRSVQRTNGTTYSSGFARPWNVSGEVEYQPAAGTGLLVLWTAGSGRPTTPVAAGFEWNPYQPATGTGEVEGAILNVGGPVNLLRLPASTRLDVAMRHQWRVGTGSFITAVRVVNLFNRADPVGIMIAADGSPQFLRGTSRGVVFEAGWVH